MLRKLYTVPPPAPNRPEVNRAIWYATMTRLRDNAGTALTSDGSSMRPLMGMVVLVVIVIGLVVSGIILM